MAEDVRCIREVLEELFKGRDAAVEKYAKVRHTQYEMNLWRQRGLPLKEVPRNVKVYFSQRFLGGKKINEASEAELNEAFKRLGYAVDDGCKGRCNRLVEELNSMLAELGFKTIEEPAKFLNWLTFDYEVRRDHTGSPVVEKPFGFEILVFKDERNRKEFWGEVQLLLYTYGRMMSMQDIAKMVICKRRSSVVLRD